MRLRFTPSDDDEGAVAIEFAIIAIALFTLLFGIIVFAVQFSARAAAAQAATEGARASVAGLTGVERQFLAQTAATAVLSRYGGMFRCPSASCVTAAPDGVNRYAVTVRLDISQFNFSTLGKLLPVLTDYPSSTVSIQIGGF